MKLIFDCILGFGCIVFVLFGFSGVKTMFTKRSNKKRAKKVISKYADIDNDVDNRSDLDVLRKL